MSDNLTAIREAISAAAESVSSLSMNKDLPQNDEDENFLLRLNHHSARLDGGLSSPAECEPFSFFSSPRNVPSSKAPDNNELKSSKNILNDINKTAIYDHHVLIELPPSTFKKLNELFGDGQELQPSSSIEIALPLWICEFLYKASQKMPVAESLQEECENCNENRNNGSKTKRFNNNNNNNNLQNSLLKQLSEMFPDLSKKVINQVAKEKGYDFDMTALHLAEHSNADLQFPDENDANPHHQQQFITQSIIVPSYCPRIITEEEQRMNSLNNAVVMNPQILCNETDQDIEKELCKLEQEGKHYNQLKNKYLGTKSYPILGYYTQIARELEERRKRLTKYRDQLIISNKSYEDSIDLHEMSAERALSAVMNKIKICRERHKNMRKLHVITGYGKTSGICVLKPRLIAFLKSKGIEARVSPNNQGVIEVNLTNINGPIE